MLTHGNKAVVERYLEECWGRGNFGYIDEAMTKDVSFRMGHSPKETRGREDIKRMISLLRQVLPDLWLRIDETIAEGDVVVARWTSGGTQTGQWKEGVPPTMKQVQWTGISIYHLKSGKIVHEGGEENMLGLLEQIGLVQRK
jgi:predicted ester cyclase